MGLFDAPQTTQPAQQGLMGLAQPQYAQNPGQFTKDLRQQNPNAFGYGVGQQPMTGMMPIGDPNQMSYASNMPQGTLAQNPGQYMNELRQKNPNPFGGTAPVMSDQTKREMLIQQGVNPDYVSPDYTAFNASSQQPQINTSDVAQQTQYAQNPGQFGKDFRQQNPNFLSYGVGQQPTGGMMPIGDSAQMPTQGGINYNGMQNANYNTAQNSASNATPNFNYLANDSVMSDDFSSRNQAAGQPVNTQTVQPNFMGQTPFGQPQTGQFTSTNPFVQAAQANAQGNIAGALQATAANRINQQTPYGSLQYQQTGTDAQGNPIWSANQQLSPELQQLTQSSLAGLQASQEKPMYGINPGETYSDAIMKRLAPQQTQAKEALDAQLANQGIMPGSEAYNRAKTLLGQTQNDALTSAIVGGMQTGLQAQGLQNTTAANIRNLATPGYVNPYNQAAVAGPDYLSAYTAQNATDIARQNAEAAQKAATMSGLFGLGSSALLGGTGSNSALGGLYSLGKDAVDKIGGSGLWNSLFPTAITGDADFLKSIGLDNTVYGSGTGGMLTDPLAGMIF